MTSAHPSCHRVNCRVSTGLDSVVCQKRNKLAEKETKANQFKGMGVGSLKNGKDLNKKSAGTFLRVLESCDLLQALHFKAVIKFASCFSSSSCGTS